MTTLEDIDPLYHFSTHYRDRLNIMDQCFPAKSAAEKKSTSSKIARRKNNPRYKTQPITFDEIKEVEEPATTPTSENNNISPANSFMSKLHLENTHPAAEERLQPHQRSETATTDSGNTRTGSAENIWYDSPYPTKLSFLDVPETMAAYHNSHTNKTQSDKTKFKSRAMRRRNNPRYKTQPITFDEIKEVEEPDTASTGEQSELKGTLTPSPTIDVLINSQKMPGDQPQTIIVGYAR